MEQLLGQPGLAQAQLCDLRRRTEYRGRRKGCLMKEAMEEGRLEKGPKLLSDEHHSVILLPTITLGDSRHQ